MDRQLIVSSLGWVGENPVGNRLRWNLLDSGSRLRAGRQTFFPKSFIVSRAFYCGSKNNISSIPIELFSVIESSQLQFERHGWVLRLAKPAQCMQFTYSGPACRMNVLSRGTRLHTRVLQSSNKMVITLHESSMDMLEFIAPKTPTPVLGDVIAFFNSGIDAERLEFSVLAEIDAAVPSLPWRNGASKRLLHFTFMNEQTWLDFQG